MKIALVILHADPARGGGERYTVDLAAALARRGHDVSLLASSHPAHPPHREVRILTLAARGLTRSGKYRSFLEATENELNASRYDVVHAMLPVTRCDVYHPHAGIAAEAEQKWNIHLNPRRKRMAAVERELLTGAHPPITIALSEYVKRSIRRHYAVAEDRLATRFNAVRTDWFVPPPPDERVFADGAVRALIVANDFRRKGLAAAIEAVSKIHRPEMKDLNLKVVGKEDVTPWRRLTKRLGVEKRVHFAGESTDARQDYQHADMLVLPTRHDPCSLVVLEALSTGLPVISTVFNGATEIMTDGVHGYVLKDPTDVDALADAMRKLLDPERRRAMSEACLALRPKLSYGHHLEQLMAIYDRAVASRGPGRGGRG